MIKDENIKIFMLCHKKVDYGLLDDSVVTPLECGADIQDNDVCELKDNTGENISAQNQFFTEDTGIFWIWKNVHSKYKGQMQYRRRLSGISEGFDFDEAFSTHDAIIAEPMDLELLYGINGLTVEQQYRMAHSHKDLELMEAIIKEKYPQYSESYDEIIKRGKMLLYSNGFVLKACDYDNYCSELFDVLYTWLDRKGIKDVEDLHKYVYDSVMDGSISNATMNPFSRKDMEYVLMYQSRIGGSLAERFFTLYASSHFKQILFVPYEKQENIIL